MQFFVASKILNKVKYYSIHYNRHMEVMLALGWAMNKGDWWYDKDPSDAKFFRANHKATDIKKEWGIYIGRLGLVLQVLNDSWYKSKWAQRRVAIIQALKQRVKNHENLSLNRIQRWFYAFKAILCILIGRRKSLWAVGDIDAVAIWYGSSNPFGYYGTEYDWTELAVGRGCFRNWYYDIYRNGA